MVRAYNEKQTSDIQISRWLPAWLFNASAARPSFNFQFYPINDSHGEGELRVQHLLCCDPWATHQLNDIERRIVNHFINVRLVKPNAKLQQIAMPDKNLIISKIKKVFFSAVATRGSCSCNCCRSGWLLGQDSWNYDVLVPVAFEFELAAANCQLITTVQAGGERLANKFAQSRKSFDCQRLPADNSYSFCFFCVCIPLRHWAVWFSHEIGG